MFDFAVKVSRHAYAINESDFEILKSYDFGEEDICDTAAISGLFGMSNRLANVINMRPYDEFYALGRCLDSTPTPSG